MSPYLTTDVPHYTVIIFWQHKSITVQHKDSNTIKEPAKLIKVYITQFHYYKYSLGAGHSLSKPRRLDIVEYSQ